jgi:hypothetical protein
VVLARINPLTRWGCVAVNSSPVGPPSVSASTTARSDPAASSTARTSSAHSSHVGMALSGTASDAPVPRRSKRIKRPKEASRSRKAATTGSSQTRSTCEKPGT